MSYNVFVVGLDEVNLAHLTAIQGAERYRFHELLPLEKVQGAERYPIGEWLREADDRLRSFDGTIDGIVGFWDFPVSLMVPILIDRYGTAGPSLPVVVNCEHKYWSRLSQRHAIPEAVPRFNKVDPFDETSVSAIGIDYPYWLKPVKAFASQLGFRVDCERERERALGAIRDGIGRFAEPFDTVLDRVPLPPEVRAVDGRWCVAEEILRGTQHTVAGYVHRGKVTIYGVIDSVNYPDSPSFFRYHYPSTLEDRIQDRAADLAREVMEHVGFDDWPFNIELFYDREHDRLMLLEINTRISQSHSALFRKVDGASNHQVLVELATGQKPDPPSGEGEFGCAGKLQLRFFEDGRLTRVPDGDDVARVEEEFPDAIVLIQAEEGQRLSELPDQDSYSYRVGVVYLGADDEADLLARWKRCRELLPFEVE